MDEDPDFGSSISSSTSQASEHVVDMPENVPPEVTIVWRDLTVVGQMSFGVMPPFDMAPTQPEVSCLHLSADHQGEVCTEAKGAFEESQWLC